MTNEADATVKVNLGGAIALYEKALTLDPKDASICFKLARAYEKAEQWQPMESALARAAMLEPNVPTYFYLQGYALVQLGLEGDTSAFQRAIPVLLHCIELDRYHPECHALLGVASEATLDTNIALQSYTRAIQAEPAQAQNYVALGTLYYNLNRPLEANEVFERGSQEIAPSENNRVALSALHLAWSKVAASRGDTATEVVQLEKAKAMAVDTSQIDFRLGRAYAVKGRTDDAKAVLSAFSKRVCKGAFAQKFRSECEQAQMWLYRLGQP